MMTAGRICRAIDAVCFGLAYIGTTAPGDRFSLLSAR